MLLPPLPIDDVLPELQSALAAGPYAVLVAPARRRQDHACANRPARRSHGETTTASSCSSPDAWRLAPPPAHMARLLGEEVGQTIGYRVRMDTRVSAKYPHRDSSPEGVFTRMLLDDPELTGIAAVHLRRVPRAQSRRRSRSCP
jgi:ATP-dependent helicase HrpB